MSSTTDPQVFHLRPRFTIDSPIEMDTLTEKIKLALDAEGVQCAGKVRRGFVSIYPLPIDKHYWSPHFSLSMVPDTQDPQKTNISGLYGPAPEVWTMFVFFYAIIALTIVIVTVIGFANRSIGESGMILWTIPFLVLAFVSMYAVSYLGQRKGHDQVEDLYNFILKNV